MGTTPFPDGFFNRGDPSPDPSFYSFPRFVTHIDDGAIEAVGLLYEELDLRGAVLDLCSSWVSHFKNAPQSLVALGMNADELAANPEATSWVVHDLNEEPELPFADATFDAVTCCVSVDYLVQPVGVFASVARVLRPGGVFVCTFSNRLFPTKAIAGWLATNDAGHVEIVEEYFRRAGGFDEPQSRRCTPVQGYFGDPLYAVWARVADRSHVPEEIQDAAEQELEYPGDETDEA
jgi:SAM-dependent methyltransferase